MPEQAVVVKFLTQEELEAGLDAVRQAPKDEGRLELIVRRPAIDQREVVAGGALDAIAGLVGDNWSTRGSTSTADGSAHPGAQLALMNVRMIALLAQEQARWPLAGDQLFVDLDLSVENLPPGTRLALGTAVIEVTAKPHTGCQKFAARFGAEALRFVNTPEGRQLRLRGMHARIVQPGAIRVGDRVRKAS
jgi:hypothetical protein